MNFNKSMIFAPQDLTEFNKISQKEAAAIISNANISGFITLDQIRKEEAIKDKKELIGKIQKTCQNNKMATVKTL